MKARRLRVLVACERSGRVRDAFLRLGHDAVSCDLEPCMNGGPHIVADALEVLKDTRGRWDLLIAFPPCTHLAVSGARYFAAKVADGRQEQAVRVFLGFALADVPKVAVENPVGVMSRLFRKPDQVLQPWQFGDAARKTTCLWLRGLAPLSWDIPLFQPRKVVGHGELVCSPGRGRFPRWMSSKGFHRSVTFPGIAQAMAEQWGGAAV